MPLDPLDAARKLSEGGGVEQELRFLADASAILSSSLDYQKTMRALARLAVPIFGDYCAVDVVREDGTFERVDLVVDDPERKELAERLRKFAPKRSVRGPAMLAIESGEAVIENEVSVATARRSAQSEVHLELIRQWATRSFMMVPLRARARSLGLFTVGSFTGRQ